MTKPDKRQPRFQGYQNPEKKLQENIEILRARGKSPDDIARELDVSRKVVLLGFRKADKVVFSSRDW